MSRRRRAGAGGAEIAAVDLSVRFAGIELPNPVIAASGTFGHGDEVAALCDPAGLGAVTVKSLAAFEWPGNAGLRMTETPGGGMLNSIGLAGPGVAHWIEHELPALEARDARVIASVWGRTIADYAAAAAPLRAVAERVLAVEVNVSCPNLEDRSRMFAHSAGATASAVGAVCDALEGALPVFAKLSPNTPELVDIAAAAVDAGAAALTLVNTLVGLAIDAEARRPVLGAGGGGLSGAPIKPVALRCVHDVARALPAVPIVGTGGVRSGLDAVEMMLAGASAVGVGTATFAEPRAALRIVGELARWCARHGVSRVEELVGRLEGP